MTEQELDKLKFLLSETRIELRSWRERNWDATKFAVAGIVGVTTISVFKSQPITLSILILLIALSATFYLMKNQLRYSEQRTASTNIEKLLGFHAEGAYFEGKLFEFDIAAGKQKYPHFIATIWMVAIIAIICVLFNAYSH